MMAVAVKSEPRFECRAERALFPTRSRQVLVPFAASYAVAADGTKFLMRSEIPAGASRTISVITNVLTKHGK